MNHIMQTIIEARDSLQVVKEWPPHAFENWSIHDAYSMQYKIINEVGVEVIGWKLGGTNKKTQEVFGVNEPYWGPVLKKNFLSSSDLIPHGSIMCAEVECAVKLAEIPENSNLDSIGMNELVEEVGLSVELPWSAFESVAEFGVNALIADLCASGKVILGKTVPFSEFQEEMMDFLYLVNKEEVASGGMANLNFGLERTLKEFIGLAYAEGFKVKQGQWVFTGGLSSCQRFSKSDEISIQSAGLGEINFSVK